MAYATGSNDNKPWDAFGEEERKQAVAEARQAMAAAQARLDLAQARADVPITASCYCRLEVADR